MVSVGRKSILFFVSLIATPSALAEEYYCILKPQAALGHQSCLIPKANNTCLDLNGKYTGLVIQCDSSDANRLQSQLGQEFYSLAGSPQAKPRKEHDSGASQEYFQRLKDQAQKEYAEKVDQGFHDMGGIAAQKAFQNKDTSNMSDAERARLTGAAADQYAAQKRQEANGDPDKIAAIDAWNQGQQDQAKNSYMSAIETAGKAAQTAAKDTSAANPQQPTWYEQAEERETLQYRNEHKDEISAQNQALQDRVQERLENEVINDATARGVDLNTEAGHAALREIKAEEIAKVQAKIDSMEDGPAKNVAQNELNDYKKDTQKYEKGQEKRASRNTDDNNVDKKSKSYSKNCQASSDLGRGGNCRTTDNVVMSAQLVDQGGEAVTTMALQGAGYAKMQSAMNSGKISDQLKASAEQQKMAGQAQMVLGATNAMMGIMQAMRTGVHKKDLAAIQAERSAEELSAGSDNKGLAKADVKKYQYAEGEQEAMQQKAQMGAFASFVKSAQKLVGGAFNLRAAKDMQKAANEMRSAEQAAEQHPSFSSGLGSDQLASADLAESAGTEDSYAVTGEDANALATDDVVGDPYADAPPAPLPDEEVAPGPPAAPLQVGAAPKGHSGGGASLGGAGGTSRNPAAQVKDSKARYAKRFSAGTTYTNTGGFGGKVGKTANDNKGGLDPSKFLAQFLPGKEEEKRQGITQQSFGRQRRRAPASLLAPHVNAFQRIRERIQAVGRRGDVGA